MPQCNVSRRASSTSVVTKFGILRRVGDLSAKRVLSTADASGQSATEAESVQAPGNSQLRRLSPSRHSSTTAPAGHLLCIHLYLIMIIHPCQAPPMDFPRPRLRKIKETHSHAARASRGTGRSPAAQPRRQTVQAMGNSPPRSHNARPCRQWESLYYAASAHRLCPVRKQTRVTTP